MRKDISFFIFFILAISSCTSVNRIDANSDSISNQQLSNFVIGKWIGYKIVTDIHGKYEKEYLIQFIDKSRLILQMKSPYGGINDEFIYEFIEENMILVENERAKGGKWIITIEEANLLVCIWSNDNCIIFTRDD